MSRYVNDSVRDAQGAIADATALAELCGDQILVLRLTQAAETLVAIASGIVAPPTPEPVEKDDLTMELN